MTNNIPVDLRSDDEVSPMQDGGIRYTAWVWNNGSCCGRQAQIQLRKDVITFAYSHPYGNPFLAIHPDQIIACQCINDKQIVNMEFFKIVKSTKNINAKEGVIIENSSISVRIRDAQLFDSFRIDVQRMVQRLRTSNGSPKPFLVLINPKSGKKNGVCLFKKCVAPIFDKMLTNYELFVTKHPGQAYNWIKECPPSELMQYRALVTVSGDGLIFEAINGMAKRQDKLVLPIGVIPAGGGNATAGSVVYESGICTKYNMVMASAFILTRNETGSTPGFPVSANQIDTGLSQPGSPVSLSLRAENLDGMRFESRLVLDGEISSHFGIQLVECGMMADMDMLSERVRWMGHSRFTYAGLHSIARVRKFAATVHYLPANCVACQTDVDNLVQQGNGESYLIKDPKTPTTNGENFQVAVECGNTEDDSKLTYSKRRLPPLSEPMPVDWPRLESRFTTIVIMNHGHLSFKVKVFRHSRMNDGMLHMIVVDHTATRYQLIHLMNELLSLRRFFDLPYVKVIPIRAVRVETHEDYPVPVMLDGEPVNGGSFQVEVINGMFSILKLS